MKKSLIFILFLSLIFNFCRLDVFAQTFATILPEDEVSSADLGISDPWLLPDSSLYFLKGWGESIDLALTFNKSKKALKQLNYASERLREMQSLAIKNYVDKKKVTSDSTIIRTMREYMTTIGSAYSNASKIDAKTKNYDQIVSSFDFTNFQQLKLFNQIDNEEAFDIGEEVFKEVLIAKAELINNYEQYIAQSEDLPQRMEDLHLALANKAENEYANIKNLAVLEDINWRINSKVGDKTAEVNQKIYNKLSSQLERLQSSGSSEEFYNYVMQLRGAKANYLKVFDNIYNTDPDLYWYLYDVEQGVMNQMQNQVLQISDAKLREEVIKPLLDGQISNLRILYDMSNDFDDPNAKRIVNSYRNQALRQATDKLASIDTAQERQKFLLANKGLPDVKDFAVLDLMVEQASDNNTKQVIDSVTKQAFNIIDQALAEATANPAKEKIFEQIAGDDPEQIIALQKLALKLPVQSQNVLNSILDKQMKRVVQRIKQTTDVNELIKFRQRIDGNIEVKNIILQKNTGLLEEINDYQIDLVFTALEEVSDPNKVFALLENYNSLLEEFPEIKATIEQLNPRYMIEYEQKQISKINNMIESTDNPEELATFAAQLSEYLTFTNIDQSVLKQIQVNIEKKMKQNLIGEAAVQFETQYLSQYNISIEDVKNDIMSDIENFEFTGDYLDDQERLKNLIYEKVEAEKTRIKEEIQQKIEQETIRQKAANELQQKETENINRTIPEAESEPLTEDQAQELIDEAAAQAAQEAAEQGATEEEQQQVAQEAQDTAQEVAEQAEQEAIQQAEDEAAAQAEQEAQENQQLPTTEQIDCSQYNFPPNCSMISDSYQRQVCEICK